LAMVWTPVRPANRAYDLIARLGTKVSLGGGKRFAVLLGATAYIPPTVACPALTADNLCSIHETKPLRCQTMPFYPYQDEADQTALLVPRKDWACDVSANAPVVYSKKKIIDRRLFDLEQNTLLADGQILRAYADHKLANGTLHRDHLTTASKIPVAGRFVENFSSFLRFYKKADLVSFAKQQHPVLLAFAAKTKGQPELEPYHAYYSQAADELSWFTVSLLSSVSLT